MSKLKDLLETILNKALQTVEDKKIDIYTIAFYHDHESKAVSICIDTKENSQEKVISQNKWSMKYWRKTFEEKNLNSLALWSANRGRNISLGDFQLVNLEYTALGSFKGGKTLYLTMMQTLLDNQERIVLNTSDKDNLLFITSGPNDEAEFMWSIIG